MRADRRPVPWARIATAIVLSLLVNAVIVAGARRYAEGWELLGQYRAPIKVTILNGDPLSGEERFRSGDEVIVERREEELVVVEPPEEMKLPEGQIVETPPPAEEKVPLDSEYLAEHNNSVPEESRTADFKINPDILSNQYSRDSRMELKDSEEAAASRFSTGARAGGTDSLSQGKGAPRSSIPSEFAFTNKEGLDAPVSASSSRQSIAGAPQNDLLNEQLGRQVALNTREFIGAAYLNRIRRQVNLYWDQCLQNTNARLSKSQYVTEVDVVLTGEGALERIEVAKESGAPALDDCVVQAFRVAGPFPNPPAQLIQRDGRVYLPEFDFTVQVGVAQMQFQGVDPRSNVQFPGILNAPR